MYFCCVDCFCKAFRVLFLRVCCKWGSHFTQLDTHFIIFFFVVLPIGKLVFFIITKWVFELLFTIHCLCFKLWKRRDRSPLRKGRMWASMFCTGRDSGRKKRGKDRLEAQVPLFGITANLCRVIFILMSSQL